MQKLNQADMSVIKLKLIIRIGLPVIMILCGITNGNAQKAHKLHFKAVLIDTHNDILTKVMEENVVFDQDLRGKTHSDLDRWKQGGLDMQFFSVWSDGKQEAPFAFANRQLDTMDAVIARNPGKIEKVFNSKQLRRATRHGKIAAMAGVEGGHQVEDNIENLDSLYRRGVRYMTLTWNNSTSWASSAFDETFKKDLPRKGLNDFGRELVKHMNDIGMIVDISHVGEQTVADVLAITSKPVIASHSSVYTICPHQRNLKDDQIRAIAKNGGVIQVNFFSGFIDSSFERKRKAFMDQRKPELDSMMASGMEDFMAEEAIFTRYRKELDEMRAPFELVIQHIDYIAKLVGPDHVGIGSDFDGITSVPKQLDDVTRYPLITEALLQKGYKPKDIRKILGGNILRVLKANEVKNGMI